MCDNFLVGSQETEDTMAANLNGLVAQVAAFFADEHPDVDWVETVGCADVLAVQFVDGPRVRVQFTEVVTEGCDPLHGVHADPHTCGLADADDE